MQATTGSGTDCGLFDFNGVADKHNLGNVQVDGGAGRGVLGWRPNL